MKIRLNFFLLFLTISLYAVDEPNNPDDQENIKRISELFKGAFRAQHSAKEKKEFQRYLRIFPETVNTIFTSVPFFMVLAFRKLWGTFQLLLDEHQLVHHFYALNVALTDKDRNNIIHVLIQTEAPPLILEQSCDLFKNLINKYNYEERQHYIKNEDKEGGYILKEYHIATPLEFLLLTKKDKWMTAQILLKHGAKITNIAKFIIGKGKHPETEKIFKKHSDKIAQIESLPLPDPLPFPIAQRAIPRPAPLRRSGGRINLLLQPPGYFDESDDEPDSYL